MLTISGHEEIANHNHTEIPFKTCLNSKYQEHHQQQMLVRMQEKRNSHTLLVGIKLVQSLWNTMWRPLKNL
jgi:hypothetical protein